MHIVKGSVKLKRYDTEGSPIFKVFGIRTAGMCLAACADGDGGTARDGRGGQLRAIYGGSV